MSSEFKWFRDILTGKTAHYPASYGDRFPTLQEIDADEAGCTDCIVTSEPDPDPDPDVPYADPEPVVYDDETEEDD